MHPTLSFLKRAHAVTKMISPQSSKRIIIACFPKSASTFLRNVISGISGYATEELCVGYDRNEQDLYLPTVIDHAFTPVVNHMHMWAREHNIGIMKSAGITPVVLVRNIFDTAVSMKDHLANHSPLFSMAYVDNTFASMPPEEQQDMVVDMCIPWFISFYVSWYKAQQQNLLNTYWLTYEQLIDDKETTVANICDFYSVEHNPESIRNAIATVENNKKRSNRNVGVQGRGKTQLTDIQRQKIIKMASYYKDVDFSLIGITE
nr:sulfotransferase domain-containing protein [uncultured Pseudodesulfovibrio sp.]